MKVVSCGKYKLLAPKCIECLKNSCVADRQEKNDIRHRSKVDNENKDKVNYDFFCYLFFGKQVLTSA